MSELTIDISALALRRLTALAAAENTTLEALAIGCLETVASSQETRRAILKARRTAGQTSIADLGWLDGYGGQSVDELLAFEGKEDPLKILIILEEAIQKKLAEHGKDARTGVEATILAVMALQREVGNGGFDQFFRNSSRIWALSIVDCLIRIGSKDGARIARKALSALKMGRPHSVQEFFEALENAMRNPSEKRDDVLQSCDEAFWKLTEIPIKLLAYARANSGGLLCT